MSTKWKKVMFDIVKYVFFAIVGAIGVSASGCIGFPQFIF